MVKTEVDVDKLLKGLRKMCKILHDEGLFDCDLYTFGFIIGALAAVNKSWKDLCWECEGCNEPIYITKKLYEKSSAEKKEVG